MLKVAVFDSGYGGEIVARNLEENLVIIEVIRVIDRNNAPYAGKSRYAICRLVEQAILPYVNKVDIIVIASFAAKCAMPYLKTRFPSQEFVSMRWPESGLNSSTQHNIMVLTGEKVKRSLEYRKWRRTLKHDNIIEPKCDHWLPLIDQGTMTERKLRQELDKYRDKEIDTVVLGSTHLWNLHGQIERALKWQSYVVDQSQDLVDQVCRALQLDGAGYADCW